MGKKKKKLRLTGGMFHQGTYKENESHGMLNKKKKGTPKEGILKGFSIARPRPSRD